MRCFIFMPTVKRIAKRFSESSCFSICLYFCPSVRVENLSWNSCNLVYGIASRKFVDFFGFGENLSNIADGLYEDISTC